MDPLSKLVFVCLWGGTLLALGLVPGLFRKFVAGVGELLTLFSSQLFSAPPVQYRTDGIPRRPIWLVVAGLAIIAAGVAQVLLF